MANLTSTDLLFTLRNLLAQPSTSGRFSDSLLLDNLNMAMKQVMLRVEWPEATYYFQTDGVHSSFSLPEIDSLLRVYVAGQALPVTSRPILDGMLMGGPVNNSPSYTPAWTQAPFTGYPMAQACSGPPTVVGSLPYWTGGPPGYYPVQGGGAIGIVPPPSKNLTVAIDCYPIPEPLSETQPIVTQTFFPQIFREAICLRALMYAFFAMGDAGSNQVEKASAGYTEQIDKVLIPWKRKLFRALPDPLQIPVPHRTYFRGPYRGPTGRGSRMGS